MLDNEADGEMEIASIVETNLDHTIVVGVLGFILVLFSVGAVLGYFIAQTAQQQITALLFWIGSNLFWGTFLLASIISKGRKSTVYREASFDERRLKQ